MKLPIVVSLLLSAISGQTATPPHLSTSQAGQHPGERETVCGAVSGKRTVTSARGRPTFVDLDGTYPNSTFTVVIWGEDASRVGELPASGHLCVTGVIAIYRGRPEIILHDSGEWTR